MKLYQIIQFLEQKLYDLPNLNDTQFLQIEPLLDGLTEVISETLIDIDNNRLIIISSLIQQWLTYHEQANAQDLSILFKEVRKELRKESIRNFNICSSSVLAALYHLNDIIAGSSAIGRGREDSIIPDEKHNRAIYQLLEDIQLSEHPVKHMIHRSRYASKNKKYETLLPLIFDIAETSYAHLIGWKVPDIKNKQKNVDTFYENQAQFCMAKGTLWILRALKKLPLDFSECLAQTTLNESVMKQLLQCSIESREIVRLEIASRRYRGGNSGATWTNIRDTVHIDLEYARSDAPRIYMANASSTFFSNSLNDQHVPKYTLEPYSL